MARSNSSAAKDYVSLAKDDFELDGFDSEAGRSRLRGQLRSSGFNNRRTAVIAAVVASVWIASVWTTRRVTLAQVEAARPPSKVSLTGASYAPEAEAVNALESWQNATASLGGLVDFEVEGKFDGSAIRAMCDSAKWVPGRWMSCDNAAGGVGNVRDSVLTCLRYAIESGSSFVLPTLDVRGEIIFGEEFLHTGGRAGIDFMWDVPFLKTNLAKFCPQMQVADSLTHVPGFALADMPPAINLQLLHPQATGEPAEDGHGVYPNKSPWPSEVNLDLDSFRKDYDKVFPAPEDIYKPTIVRVHRTQFQWPIERDSAKFRNTFGRLLKFKPVVQELASQVYHELDRLADHSSYFGMHLRLEEDVGDRWGSFEELTKPYLDKLVEKGHKLVYVACGDPKILDQFEAHLAVVAPDVRMLTKYHLLASHPLSLEKLDSLPFDQQALVDYQMLLKSEYFAGTSFSSFSVNLGARRHLLSDRPDQVMQEEDDGQSMLRESSWLWTMRQVVWP